MRIILEGGKSLVDAPCKNSTLKDLNLNANKLVSEEGKSVPCKNSTSTLLKLGYNDFELEGGTALANELETTCGLIKNVPREILLIEHSNLRCSHPNPNYNAFLVSYAGFYLENKC
ncbi:hypothetical protein C2G38_2190354 [Gigaspora rosea]|uniref:Uncharacterized protein n=1 Tax=Gigaspora rosea TaxID=44941 RepID=A0A397V2Q1_9GLOM|nr:hypothetical protein C2G38_2190354 [Gigaspora rosea]